MKALYFISNLLWVATFTSSCVAYYIRPPKRNLLNYNFILGVFSIMMLILNLCLPDSYVAIVAFVLAIAGVAAAVRQFMARPQV
jgi:hypothetical protein